MRNYLCVFILIQQMWEQEKHHLKQMKELVILYRVRPTILLPLWDVAGYMLGEHQRFSFPNISLWDMYPPKHSCDFDVLLLGAGTALLGKKAAMACTVAVEESIAVHYNNQIRVLVEEDPEKYKELLQVSLC